jgi:hypothetical protein
VEMSNHSSKLSLLFWASLKDQYFMSGQDVPTGGFKELFQTPFGKCLVYGISLLRYGLYIVYKPYSLYIIVICTYINI